MIAFLNTHHEGLGYQPLTLAVQSDDGLERVQGLLRDLPPRTEQVHAKEA